MCSLSNIRRGSNFLAGGGRTKNREGSDSQPLPLLPSPLFLPFSQAWPHHPVGAIQMADGPGGFCQEGAHWCVSLSSLRDARAVFLPGVDTLHQERTITATMVGWQTEDLCWKAEKIVSELSVNPRPGTPLEPRPSVHQRSTEPMQAEGFLKSGCSPSQ